MIKSVYIHIPFCENICTYCDFCKFFYHEKIVDNYLTSLEKEIKNNYKGDAITTVYVGGGTPSCLNLNQLRKLFEIIKTFNFDSDYEFTFECNIENIDESKLKFLYENKVNRLSVGIQTFNENHLHFLDRKHDVGDVFTIIEKAKNIGFKNINVDLMYAFPNQKVEEVNKDLDLFLKLDIPHISIYSLIIEPHTKLYINKTKNIDEETDYEMYKLIQEKLRDNGYIHYEISNYGKEGYESKHNLTYWNNNEYYGFGLGAGGYVNNKRYTNTRNINKYNEGFYQKEFEMIDSNLMLEYEFILGFRKINGINKQIFYNKFNLNIMENEIIKKLISQGKLINDGDNIRINDKYIYLSNEILLEFV